jgi:exonuclease III
MTNVRRQAVFVNRDTIGISIDKKTSDVHAKTQKKMSNFFQLKTKESTATSSESNLENSMKTVLQGVHFDFENMEKSFAGEGRTITIETDKFYLVACYVPNSGKNVVV